MLCGTGSFIFVRFHEIIFMKTYSLLFAIVSVGILSCRTVASKEPSAYEKVATEQRLVWLQGSDSYVLGPFVDILIDSTNRVTVMDIRKGNLDSSFRSSEIDATPLGYSSSTVWMRLILFNADTAAHEWYLEYPMPLTDFIEVYVPDAQGFHFAQSAGDLLPFTDRTIKHRNPIFRVVLQKNQVGVAYVKIRSQNSIKVKMTLWTPLAFVEKVRTEYLFMGMLYGALGIMVFYNLFLFFMIRDRSYVYYVLYISSMLLAQIVTNGQGLEFLWPVHPEWNDAILAILIGLVFATSGQFSRSFLQTNRTSERLDKIILSLMVISLGCGLISLWTDAWILIIGQIFSVIGLTVPIVFLVAGFLSWRSGFTPARYYLIAWVVLLFGIGIYSLSNLGLIPSNPVTDNILDVGVVVEMVLLSIGLGARINRVHAELAQERVDAEKLARERDVEKAQAKESELRAQAAETQAKSQQAEIENARKLSGMNAELEQKNIMLGALNDQMDRTVAIVQSLNSAITLNELLHSILEKTQAITHVTSASVLAWDRATNKFKFKACLGVDFKKLESIELTQEEVLQRYVQEGAEIEKDIWVVHHITGRIAQNKFDELPPLDSLLVVCLRGDKRIEGYLLFDNIQYSDLSGKDVLLLKNLKEHLQWAILKARLLEESRMLNEQKNEYLGIVAHDLRNPLAAILGYTELVMADVKTGRLIPSDILSDLGKVHAVGKHMSFFITELLDIASIESGKVRLDKRSTSLAMIVNDIFHLHFRRAEQKNITLICESLDSLPNVMADRLRISSVVDNLISNAVKYTHAGGSIKIFGVAHGSEITIHVQDTGQGLTPEDLEKVFTTFTKLSAKPTADETSTGLGLAIVKKIVEIHGGRVWVESKQGKGSTFSFSLPVGKPESGEVL